MTALEVEVAVIIDVEDTEERWSCVSFPVVSTGVVSIALFGRLAPFCRLFTDLVLEYNVLTKTLLFHYFNFFLVAMTSIKPLHATDLLQHNNINLDPLTENFYLYFYLHYISNFPAICYQSVSSNSQPTGYMLAKTEGRAKEWHAHISAVTVDPQLGWDLNFVIFSKSSSSQKDQLMLGL